MEITVAQLQGASVPVTVLGTHGYLDASNYQDLIAKAQETYDAGARDLLLDLSDTPYMSSSGLVALQSVASLVRGESLADSEEGWGAIRAIDRHRDSGLQQHLKLLSPQPRVERVLDMVGFTRFLEVYTDLDAAIASF
jgi:anti-anti-sigma regulatory factor